jgi:hypothetical protein
VGALVEEHHPDAVAERLGDRSSLEEEAAQIEREAVDEHHCQRGCERTDLLVVEPGAVFRRDHPVAVDRLIRELLGAATRHGPSTGGCGPIDGDRNGSTRRHEPECATNEAGPYAHPAVPT